MPKKRSKKSAKVVPTAGSPSSSRRRRRERTPQRGERPRAEQAEIRLALLQAKTEEFASMSERTSCIARGEYKIKTAS